MRDSYDVGGASDDCVRVAIAEYGEILLSKVLEMRRRFIERAVLVYLSGHKPDKSWAIGRESLEIMVKDFGPYTALSQELRSELRALMAIWRGGGVNVWNLDLICNA